MNQEDHHSTPEPSPNDVATGKHASADQVSEETHASGEQSADQASDFSTAPWHFSWPAKVAYLFAGTIFPVICFLLASSPGLRPLWQSGELQDFAILLLAPQSAFPFFPLLLYSTGSMIAMLCDPARFSRYFLTRFGVYSGVVLAIQYFLTMACAFDSHGCLVFLIVSPQLALVGWGIAYIGVVLFRRVMKKDSILRDLSMPIGVLISWVGAMLLFATLGLVFIFFPIVMVGFAFCATPWAVIGFVLMSAQIIGYRRGGSWQFSLAQLLGFISWWAMYFAAWRLSIKMMWIEYAKLPTTQPTDCYVATAAARGHRRWVGANPVRTAAGQTLWANDQLRHLKAAELAMVATCPRIHRWIRAVYDRLGPRAAALLVHPLLADVAYVAIKPIEWTARVAMRLLLPDSKALIVRLYREHCVSARREP